METQATFAERLVERQMLSSEEMERVPSFRKNNKLR